MEQIFFITLLVVAISLVFLSVMFKKPLLALFGGITFILLGLFSLLGVNIDVGNVVTSQYSYFNGTLTNQTLLNSSVFEVKKDVSSFLVYGLLGLAFLLMSTLELFYNSSGGVPESEED